MNAGFSALGRRVVRSGVWQGIIAILMLGGFLVWMRRDVFAPRVESSTKAQSSVALPVDKAEAIETQPIPSGDAAIAPQIEGHSISRSESPALAKRKFDLPKPTETVMAPETSAVPAAANNIANSGERQIRLAQLLKEAEEEKSKNPQQAERTLLTAAGYHVGLGDWAAAKRIYDQLAAASDPEVAYAVSRNLAVVNGNLAVEAEVDPNRREWMQLELGALHRSFGHDQAAKKIWRRLERAATQQEVRTEATSRLSLHFPPVPAASPPAGTR